MIPEAAIESACRAEFSDWDTNGDEWWRGMTRKRMRKALEAAAPHMMAEAQAVAWDRAVGSMVYDDGTPLEIMSNSNPYRSAK